VSREALFGDAWTDRGGDGPQLVLTHANGFPPEIARLVIDFAAGRGDG
jgi:hypothetical protein